MKFPARTLLASFAAVMIGASVSCASPNARSYDELQVYFLPWNVETALRLDPANVRAESTQRLKIRSREKIEQFLSNVQRLKCTAGPADPELDFRYVLELRFKGKLMSSYAGTENFLVPIGSKQLCNSNPGILESLLK